MSNVVKLPGSGQDSCSGCQSDTQILNVQGFIENISLSIFDKTCSIRCQRDCNDPNNGRIFIQIQYTAPCTKTGEDQIWSGRKWYLSEHMTDDEIVKTCFAAFKAAVEHEVMEGFKFGGIIVFNPHVNFHALMNVSHKEVHRG